MRVLCLSLKMIIRTHVFFGMHCDLKTNLCHDTTMYFVVFYKMNAMTCSHIFICFIFNIQFFVLFFSHVLSIIILSYLFVCSGILAI